MRASLPSYSIWTRFCSCASFDVAYEFENTVASRHDLPCFVREAGGMLQTCRCAWPCIIMSSLGIAANQPFTYAR